MYLFYVYGSGLGHLNRINNFIYTKKITEEACVIITNSSFSNYIPKTSIVIFKEDSFFKDKINFNLFISACITKYNISTLVVDVFPAGFYGEFENGFNDFNVTTILLARILKENYFQTYFSPNYNLIYLLEEGIIQKKYTANKTAFLHLETKPVEFKQLSNPLNKPFFLIIHSSPEEEVILLYKQALLYRTDEHICIYSYSSMSSSQLHEKTIVMEKQKVQKEILDAADKIFTGCGFNSILETKNYRKKQHIIPFNRKYDDQFKRKTIIDLNKK